VKLYHINHSGLVFTDIVQYELRRTVSCSHSIANVFVSLAVSEMFSVQ